LLRQWLSAAGIQPDRDVRIVVVPPPQMVPNLKAGHLDGFCVGEPWNSVAIRAGQGSVVAVSAELEPYHPEKVLMVRREFAEQRAPEHLGLIAALLEACAYCDQPANHEHITAVLARPDYVAVPAEVLRSGLSGHFNFTRGAGRSISDFCIFHRHDANEPSADKAGWVMRSLRIGGLCKDPSLLSAALGRRVFRADIFAAAQRLQLDSSSHHEKQNESHTHTAIY
jgi:ABC-type nitrate/sulfonate/bicarbonate transport system substrate-binding protein